MIDYFNVDFYYFGCKTDDIKIVPKTARIKNKATKPVKAKLHAGTGKDHRNGKDSVTG